MTYALLILRQIPHTVRIALYVAWLVAAVALFILHAFNVDLPYAELNKGLLGAATFLTLQASTNVHPVED